MKAELVDRQVLLLDARHVGCELNARKFAYAIKALGLREQENRPIPAPRGGRTKHYYREAAWAIAALSNMPASELQRQHDELEPLRQRWTKLATDDDYRHPVSWIPGGHDSEFGALLLFAFGKDNGPDPTELLARLDKDDSLLEVSSYGRAFLSSVIDAYLDACRERIGRALRRAPQQERSRDMSDEEFAQTFVMRLGQWMETIGGLEGGDA